MSAYPKLMVEITGTAHHRCLDNVKFPVVVEAIVRPQYNNCSFAEPLALVDPYWIEVMGGDPEQYKDGHQPLQFYFGFSAEFLSKEDEEFYEKRKQAKIERDLAHLTGENND
jgi:hypothetical protein